LSRYLKATARYGATLLYSLSFYRQKWPTVLTTKYHAEKIITVLTCTVATIPGTSAVRVADLGCLSRVPDPDFYPSQIPDPKTATKERGEKTFSYRGGYPQISQN
jgi:hypothetical protein